ncbi:MAG TPA: zinc ribbon domain-containing protein [Ktedonobacteraceae bacterium]
MRCPYCGRNSERATFCSYCGRDLRTPPQQQPVAGQQPPQGYPTSAPRQQPPYQQPRQAPPASGYPPPQQSRRTRQPDAPPPPPPAPAPPPPAPEAPAPFPPRTMEHLHALEPGALTYTIMDTTDDKKRKRTVRIAYPKSVGWQQVATLLKAFKELQETSFETIIIQGYLPKDPGLYAFTNGQLAFDRNVLLGSQTMNRYQIETGNGFEMDSVRIVLSE